MSLLLHRATGMLCLKPSCSGILAHASVCFVWLFLRVFFLLISFWYNFLIYILFLLCWFENLNPGMKGFRLLPYMNSLLLFFLFVYISETHFSSLVWSLFGSCLSPRGEWPARHFLLPRLIWLLFPVSVTFYGTVSFPGLHPPASYAEFQFKTTGDVSYKTVDFLWLEFVYVFLVSRYCSLLRHFFTWLC